MDSIWNITPMETNDKGMQKLIRNTPKMSVEELQKEANTLNEQKRIKEADLITALDDGRLKGKSIIKEANRIKKQRENNSKKKKA